MRRREGPERAGRHRRTEVRAADADVDHVGHRLAEGAAQAPFAHVGGEFEHLGALGLDVGHDVVTVQENRLAGEIAQRGVQGGAPFGRIDALAAEHGVALGLDPGGLGKPDQQGKRRRADPLLRIVVEEIVEDDAKTLEALGVGGEFGADRAGENVAAMVGELGEDGGKRCLRHGSFPFPSGALCVRPTRRVCFICRLNCNCETCV